MSIKIVVALSLVISSLFGGWESIDHRVAKDESGIWAAQDKLPFYLAAAVGVGALMEGNQTRMGRTLWQSIDSSVLSYAVTMAGKEVFSRQRPADTDNPNRWFSGGESMPSGHTAITTALITPFILEYSEENPWLHLLWGVPLYQAIGRIKAQEHWQSDVIAGFGVGVGSALAARHYGPWVVRLMPGGVYAGISLNW
ncbi:MAG: phosphatase PAP2 family protein [Sulfuricurvum sp.]|uniref:phosphatase PAP2 family protein n=1 Tax=Sulfuricurvum sp. TaxID=2025608 RepID=UPI0025E4DC4D|nr:phosphatase PAP2 family protein [Sulfuricurvum sp.]MCK9371829.1 phosphatase PAP2 family protein [Sulfuricurvum sp.]